MSEQTHNEEIGERLAKTVSKIFHPLIMPTYGMIFLAMLSSVTVLALPLRVNLELIFFSSF